MMKRTVLLVVLVVSAAAVAGCIDGGDDGEPGDDVDDEAANGFADDLQGDEEFDDIDRQTAEQMARCERGTSHTYDYPDHQTGELESTTVTVEGTETHDGVQFCKFRAESTEFGDDFEGVDALEGRTLDRVEWWVAMEDLDPHTERLDQGNAMMRMYDTNGNIMVSWEFRDDSFEMTFYDEDGEEFDPYEAIVEDVPEEYQDEIPDDFGF